VAHARAVDARGTSVAWFGMLAAILEGLVVTWLVALLRVVCARRRPAGVGAPIVSLASVRAKRRRAA